MEYWYLDKDTGVIYAYPTPKARYYSIRALVRSNGANLESLELWETNADYVPRLNIRPCPVGLRFVLRGDSRILIVQYIQKFLFQMMIFVQNDENHKMFKIMLTIAAHGCII